MRDFSGHGLGRIFHDAPNILHYGKPGTGPVLKPGMFFTVEPMVNVGTWQVKILSDGWTAVTRDKQLSAQFEHSVGITETGVEFFTLSPKQLAKPPYNLKAVQARPDPPGVFGDEHVSFWIPGTSHPAGEQRDRAACRRPCAQDSVNCPASACVGSIDSRLPAPSCSFKAASSLSRRRAGISSRKFTASTDPALLDAAGGIGGAERPLPRAAAPRRRRAATGRAGCGIPQHVGDRAPGDARYLRIGPIAEGEHAPAAVGQHQHMRTVARQSARMMQPPAVLRVERTAARPSP